MGAFPPISHDFLRFSSHASGLVFLRAVTRGHFRLSYGGTVSGCMDVNSAKSAAGGYSVKARLEELEEVGYVY